MRRAAFTLIELIVATAITGLVGAAMVSTVTRQQRFHSAASEMLGLRSQLRDAADVLTSDIRSAAVASHGLPLMTDSAIEMVTSIGSSVLCETPSGATILLPPAKLANGNTLTSILAQPDDGDIAMLYGNPSASGSSATWEALETVSFTARSLASTCSPSTGFTTAADAAAGSSGFAVTLSAPPTAAVRKGAPVRFLRRVRYSLYRSSDSRWYLGHRRCRVLPPAACTSVQPVSGPYNQYSVGAGSGLGLRYYDTAGSELPAGGTGASVARIDIVLRGAIGRDAGMAGDARQRYRDSVVVSVSPRNRIR
ncbi:MAG: type II secretion system protein [Gemmatimonadaceae bacterium]